MTQGPDIDFDTLLPSLSERVAQAKLRPVRGRVRRILGQLVHASVDGAGIGELCYLRDPLSGRSVPAEVIGFEAENAILSPIGDLYGMSTRTEVIATGAPQSVPVGEALLGRVVSPLGNFIDGAPKPSIDALSEYPVHAAPPAPLSRQLIKHPLALGIRAIDGPLTVARGQRIGIFGEPGVGKSSLISAIVRGSEAEVIVLGLVGERGREVRELLEVQLSAEARRRTVCVVATSDRPAIERVRSAMVATSVAEYFRDQGRDVLLLVDSITRFARAQREIGLAAGEPPTRRGFSALVLCGLTAFARALRAGRARQHNRSVHCAHRG